MSGPFKATRLAFFGLLLATGPIAASEVDEAPIGEAVERTSAMTDP